MRAVYADRAAIWTEWSAACEATLTATLSPSARSSEQAARVFTVSGRTLAVGKRFYALLILSGLQAGSWYEYTLSSRGEQGAAEIEQAADLQCFRTLDLPEERHPLRIAYGSCRNLSEAAPDALQAFGPWLQQREEERESCWPHLLLLVGDQIYADEPVQDLLQSPRQKRPEQPVLQSFEEYAARYTYSWTCDRGIRQVLAVLPTAMIFDDHEITNGWNSSPRWQLEAWQEGFAETLIDGLVAYWIYQGWGNVCLHSAETYPLLALMQQTMDNEDLLTALRQSIRQALLTREPLAWYYTLPTTPPLFVADVRGDRSKLFAGEKLDEHTPRILSKQQMADLYTWSQANEHSVALLVSSVPALLPPAIGLAEYIMGARPLERTSSRFWRSLRKRLIAGQQTMADRLSFDHWPVFGETWHELVELLAARRHDLIILSGDVHFSYAMRGSRASQGPRLYQLVASPFRNALGRKESMMIAGQSWLLRAFYGGLRLRMLPLRKKATRRAPPRMLFQNVIALVTLTPQAEGTYRFQQSYLGIGTNELEEIGSLASEKN